MRTQQPLIAGLVAIALCFGCNSTKDTQNKGLKEDQAIRERSNAGGKAFLVQESRKGVTFTSYLVGDPSTVQEFSSARVELDLQAGKLSSETAWSLLADAWAYYRSIQVADTGDGSSASKSFSDQQQAMARVQRIKVHQLMVTLDANMTKAFIEEYKAGDEDLGKGFGQTKPSSTPSIRRTPPPPPGTPPAAK